MNRYIDFSDASIDAITEHLTQTEQAPGYAKLANDVLCRLEANCGSLSEGHCRWLVTNMKRNGREIPAELREFLPRKSSKVVPYPQQQIIREPENEDNKGVGRLVAVLERLEKLLEARL